MENLHEQIKAYILKLEYSIREYMRNPATPNAAQGIMAMVECLNMLKGAEEAICTGREMTKADAEAWAAHMVNEDGTTGPHWPMEQTTALAEKHGPFVGPYFPVVLEDHHEHDVLRLRQRGHPLWRQHGGILRGAGPGVPF